MFTTNVNRTSLGGKEMQVLVCQILGITESWNFLFSPPFSYLVKIGRKLLLMVNFGTIPPTSE